MEKEEKVRKYKNDEFTNIVDDYYYHSIIYDDKGKTIFKVIEEAFKNYYDLKVNT